MATKATAKDISFYKVVLQLPKGAKANSANIYDLDFKYFETTAPANKPPDVSAPGWQAVGTHEHPLFLKRPGKMQFVFRDDSGKIAHVRKIHIDFTPWRHGILSPLAADVEAKGEMGKFGIKADKMRAGADIPVAGWSKLVEQRQYFGLRVEMEAEDSKGQKVRLLRDDPEIVVDPMPS